MLGISSQNVNEKMAEVAGAAPTVPLREREFSKLLRKTNYSSHFQMVAMAGLPPAKVGDFKFPCSCIRCQPTLPKLFEPRESVLDFFHFNHLPVDGEFVLIFLRSFL